jgi:hypothetical protein
MLPKNKLGAELFRNLNVVGSEHKQGSKPRTVNLNDLKMGVIHKIGRRKPLLHVFMFRKEQEYHCKQKKFATYFPTATLQSYATNVYDRECN